MIIYEGKIDPSKTDCKKVKTKKSPFPFRQRRGNGP
jgi:hypothetical protein